VIPKKKVLHCILVYSQLFIHFQDNKEAFSVSLDAETKTSSVLVQNYQIVSLPSLLFLNHNRSMFIPTKEL